MYIFKIVRTNKKTDKQTKVQVFATFSYIIEPLNLSDFMMKIIEAFNMLQFCWNLNLLLP